MSEDIALSPSQIAAIKAHAAYLREFAAVNTVAAEVVLDLAALQRAAAAPWAREERSEGGAPPSADPFLELREVARERLKGQERAVVEALCAAGGALPIVDLATRAGLGWDDEFRGFRDAQRRLNAKLKPRGWILARADNSAILKALKRR